MDAVSKLGAVLVTDRSDTEESTSDEGLASHNLDMASGKDAASKLGVGLESDNPGMELGWCTEWHSGAGSKWDVVLALRN